MREWLKKLRTEKQMTMKEMGTKLGISESYYCAVENGSRQKKMDIMLVSSLSDALGIPIADIVAYESEYLSASAS